MTRSAPWFLVVICLAGIFLARESHRHGYVSGADRAFYDWLIANASLPPAESPGPHPIVTLVGIDDTITSVPGRLPISPLEYASFFQIVSKYNPAVVAVEPVLDWPRMPAGTEEILANQAMQLPKLLLGVELGSDPGHARDPGVLAALTKVSGSPAGLPEFPEIVGSPNEHLLSLATAAGAINLPGLAGAPVRDLPLLFRSRDRIVPSFALQMLMLGMRLAPSEVSVQLGSYVQMGANLRLNIGPQGRALLDERLYPTLNRLNLDDVGLLAAGQATPQVQAAAERMRDGIVVLGQTNRDEQTLALVDGQPISPTELFAWAAASLQRTPAPRRAGVRWDIAIILLWMLVGWRLLRRRAVLAVATVFLGLVTYGLVALSVFELDRLWLPGSLPLALGLLIGGLLWFVPRTSPPAPTAAVLPVSDAGVSGL